MEEFISKMAVVPGRAFVEPSARSIYLHRAIRNIDIEKLGFTKEFLSFTEDSEFIFRFFEELEAEKTEIEDISGRDIYAQYDDHLQLLAETRRRYCEILDTLGLTDRICARNYRISENLLDRFESIDIHIDGYPSRYEIELLEKIDIPVTIHYTATPYNEKLSERFGITHRSGNAVSFDMKSRTIISSQPVDGPNRDEIESVALPSKTAQTAFIMSSVEKFIERGANPDRVAVILPDESFASYLRLFDETRNFNFAMGIPFTESRYYIRLKKFYDSLSSPDGTSDEALSEKFERVGDFDSFMEFLHSIESSEKEKAEIEERLYIFGRQRELMSGLDRTILLHEWLERISGLSLDDVGGGRITVMGLLESRGIDFDGVVIADFNDSKVPKVSRKDLFLDSRIRADAGMPTRKDKENLQKHYYYRLLANSSMTAISYIKDEENMESRFLRELGIETPSDITIGYRELLIPDDEIPTETTETITAPNTLLSTAKVTPSALKDLLVCPRRFHYKYQLKISSDCGEGSDNIGIAIHEALENAVKAKSSFENHDDYHAFVMDYLYRNSDSPLVKFEISTEWESRLYKFCEDDFPNLMKYDQPIVEEWLSVKYGDFRLDSRIDRIDIGKDIVRLIDYKSGKNISKTKEDERDFQLLFYRLWAEERYPSHEILTIYMDLYTPREEVVDERPGDRERLSGILSEISAKETMDYDMTTEIKECTYCDYAIACGRS
jgi:CRISPR/Cas system-associated exonuclease Cas4 (RecB family)/DNA-directed RNA polymerase subunit N (RpoN/RPB10)